MAAKGLEAPVLAVVTSHAAWLRALRDYRDETVHRLIVQEPAAGWTVSHNGLSAGAMLPIVVPCQTPKLPHDTRRSRSTEVECPHGLTLRESHAAVTYPDGSQRVLEHEIVYEPAPGFERIERFMAENLATYDELLADMFDTLTALAFQQAPAKPLPIAAVVSLPIHAAKLSG